MDQYSNYLMWMNKTILNSHFRSSFNSLNSSWEEQAFAEDAANPLGECIWPPRSYSCTFCGREFRSAQALGGHMNVHRRDRAKLKQSLSPESEVQICNSDSNPSFLPLPGSPNSNISPLSNSEFPCSLTPSWSDFETAKLLSISDLKAGCEKNTRKEEHVFLGHDDYYVETNLSVGLNLVVSQNQVEESNGSEKVNYKRHKSTPISLPFFLKPCSSDIYPFHAEVVGIKISSMEEIDLELRLGDPPAVT